LKETKVSRKKDKNNNATKNYEFGQLWPFRSRGCFVRKYKTNKKQKKWNRNTNANSLILPKAGPGVAPCFPRETLSGLWPFCGGSLLLHLSKIIAPRSLQLLKLLVQFWAKLLNEASTDSG
jgi:hypothetical protein